MRLGRGERRHGGRSKNSILANMFEAVLGALYLDGGIDAARTFLARELGPVLAHPGPRARDPKTELQELLQAGGREPPRYVTDRGNRAGARAPLLGGSARGRELARRRLERLKRAAEQAAARAALDALAAEKTQRRRGRSRPKRARELRILQLTQRRSFVYRAALGGCAFGIRASGPTDTCARVPTP